jgi:hypothetical protein
MTKKLKIGFADSHEHIVQFFTSILSTRYDLEIDNSNPEFLLFGDENFGQANKKYSKDDCIKVFYTGENRRPENYDCHYAITFDHNFEPWHYRLPLYVIYMWALEYVHNTKYHFNYIFDPEPPLEKTKFATFVASNEKCRERNEFFEKLHRIKYVDSGGRVFNNTNSSLDGEEAKLDFLSTRKFNICFENGSYPGYVTEKILHAFYARTVPIYWGSETISSDFNPEAFINVHDFTNFDSAINYVLRVNEDDDLYNQYLYAHKFVNNIPPSHIMIDNFLNWFDAVVYNKILQR